MAPKTATNSDQIMAALGDALVNLNKQMAEMRKDMDALKSKPAQAVSEPSVVHVGSNGTVKMVADPTDAQLREFAIAHDLAVNTKGMIAKNHPVRSQYAAEYRAQNGKVNTRVNGSKENGAKWWETVTPSAEKQFTPRPSAKDAADEYVRHPEHDAVESLLDFGPEVIFGLARMGKENAVPSLRRVPIGGNHRRCIGLLARGVNTPSVKLVVCDALAIARSAGFESELPV